jgi:hypothetical protein
MSYPQPPQPLPPLDLPPLPDAAAAALLEVLYELLFQVEGHYFPQLSRYHAARACDSLSPPDPYDGVPDFDDPLPF